METGTRNCLGLALILVTYLVKLSLYVLPWLLLGYLPARYLSGLGDLSISEPTVIVLSAFLAVGPLQFLYNDYLRKKGNPARVVSRDMLGANWAGGPGMVGKVVVITLRLYVIFCVLLMATLFLYLRSEGVIIDQTRLMAYVAVSQWLSLVVVPVLITARIRDSRQMLGMNGAEPTAQEAQPPSRDV